MQSFPATRAHALQRLEEFAPRAGEVYACERNYDLGPQRRGNVSLLSPYLRHRMITEDEVAAAVLREHDIETAAKFIDEVCWRTYWKGWLQARPQVFHHYVNTLIEHEMALSSDRSLARRYEAAIEGSTSIASFDAWVGELVTTGYLHNHARMWFASIWVFTLRLPWQLGAAFFLRHLLDGDIASNTLSWRWVAGRHTPGKAYLATSENIAKFTDGRFQPTEKLAGELPAIDIEELPDAAPLPDLPPQPEGPVVLIVTSDDLHPETWLADGQVRGLILVEPQDVFDWFGDSVVAFKLAAMDDAQRRLAARFDCPAYRLATDEANDGALSQWHDELGRPPLVAVEPVVGPGQDDVAAVCANLANATSPAMLSLIRRSWDDRLWPHATKGFWNLKKHIRPALADLGLN